VAIRRGGTSLLAALLLVATAWAPTTASAAAFDTHLRRAPYLTDLVGLHVLVNWATDRSATTGSLLWGPVSGGTCTLTNAETATRTPLTVGSLSEYQWKASLTLPATGTYCYRPYLAGTDLLAGNSSPEFVTQAAAGSTAPFSFGVLGDWGQVDADGDNPDQANLMTQIANSGLRFMLTTGDNGHPSGNQTLYGDLVQTGADTSAIFGPSFWAVPGSSVPIFPAAGNHGLTGTPNSGLTNWPQDVAVASSGGRYQTDTYCCVNGSSSANYSSAWYAFDAGPARVYVLESAWGDTNPGDADPYANDAAARFAPGTPEYEWLVNDLQSHPSGLKFAVSHYPLYSDSKSQISDTYLQGPANLEGILTQYGVNVAFNGHAHLYERNVPSAPGAPVTYVTGGGGAKLAPIGPCHSYDAYGIGWGNTANKGSRCGSAAVPTAKSQVFHFLKVTVAGTSVTVAPTDSLGNTFDVQTYNFENSLPDTVIDSGPPATTNSGTATFSFRSTLTPATFACSLDGAPATGCTSPATYSGLADGSHSFTVAATSGSGTDPVPASSSWTVDTTEPTPPVFSDGFEAGNLSAWTSSAGLTVQGAPTYSGSFAARATTTNGNTYAKKTLPTTYDDAYSRVFINVQSTSSQVNLLRHRTASDSSLAYLFVSSAGVLSVRNDVLGVTTASSTIVQPGSGWHSIELHTLINGTSSVIEVWFDGVRVDALSSTTSLGTTNVGRLQLGEVQSGRTYDVAFDEAAFGTQRIGV
jgi:hypothetical protein